MESRALRQLFVRCYSAVLDHQRMQHRLGALYLQKPVDLGSFGWEQVPLRRAESGVASLRDVMCPLSHAEAPQFFLS